MVRNILPRRPSDLIALVSVTTTVFLFIHTQTLNNRIKLINETQPQRDESQPQVLSFTLPNRVYSLSELNRTQDAVKDTLFFNRVPKVGSQTMMDLLRKLGTRNGFNFHKDVTQKVETIKLSFYEESRLTTMIDMFTPPAVYVKHTCFTNFTRHGYDMPIYINLVRDPIERVISWFYYIRAPWYIIERRQHFPELPLPHPSWLKKDFESCVLAGDRECRFEPGEIHDGVGDHRRQAMFFCGHHEKCSEFDGEWVIQKAKENVEKYYSVVGVLEDLELSLTVMDKYIPRFFDGALEVYHSKGGKVNRNNYKPPVSEKVKQILRRNFTNEMDFYNFCRQRLHQQYAALIQNGIISSPTTTSGN